MDNIQDLIDSKNALTKLCDALEISEENILQDKNKQWTIVGKEDKPIKLIQSIINDNQRAYFYVVEADTRQKWTAIEKKLTSFGFKVGQETKPKSATRWYFSIRRLPENTEGEEIRNFLGIRKTRKKGKNKGMFSPKNQPSSATLQNDLPWS